MIARAYSELDRSTSELEYLRVEPFTTVYGEIEEALETKEEVAELKSTVDVLNRRLDEQKRTLDSLQEFMDARANCYKCPVFY